MPFAKPELPARGKLKNQATRRPARKIMAVIISGAILGGVEAGLNLLWPDHPFTPLMEQFGLWIQAGVMIAAGYLVKERE